MNRLDDMIEFYRLLDVLANRVGGPRLLADCSGRDDWPERGVPFFFEEGEIRQESGEGPRVVRVGTHCVSEGSRTTLWKRLRQHRGSRHGGGNHRGSVSRWWVGDALSSRETSLAVGSWLDRGASSPQVKSAEHRLECLVSDYIGHMPFLWIAIGDPAGVNSRRTYIERNAVALLSNYGGTDQLDGRSSGWLGSYSSSEKIRGSGLWNSDHVEEDYERAFLAELEQYVMAMPR